nr:MAG TPA: hypothetical protein [Bacteriophage sp.]
MCYQHHFITCKISSLATLRYNNINYLELCQ